MRKIEAIIKPFKLSEVKDALQEIGLSGMTIIDVKGFGRQRGQEGISVDNNYDDEFRVKTKIELIVEDKNLDIAIEAIKKSAFSGKIGDGKIFVTTVDDVIRIRTGEKGNQAI